MPSFAFWKSSKPDESKSPLLSDAAVKAELSVIIPGASKGVDLNPGNQDSGVFLFDEDAQEIPGDATPVIGPKTGLLTETRQERGSQSSTRGEATAESSFLDIHEPSPLPQSPALVPEEPLVRDRIGEKVEIVSQTVQKEEVALRVESPQLASHPLEKSSSVTETSEEESASASQLRPVSLVPKEPGPTLAVEKRATPAALRRVETNIHDRDSGVYLSDKETSPARSRPSSIVSNDNAALRSRVASLSKPSTPSPQRTNSIARLQRPAELNLGFSSATDPAKPKSELDMRYDLIRNSKTQSKAALRSPTQLLQDRLNMSSSKKDAEEKVRVFTPPRATVNGCLLPGPGAQSEAFTSTSIRARTEAGGRPAWWCKFDKLVVFDGIEQVHGESRLKTRTSKGLTIAKRRGDLETVVIPLDCGHCHEMLNRHEWKSDMRVCKRSVCWDCKERCRWEFEQEKIMTAATPRTDANRERADSVLQDEPGRSHELRKEIAASVGAL
ncbi:hypothetical protein E8E12_004210 [Didymella heteroderae]|uniref:Uncharacterized protein n=1 Tax=Didymella heteroderae TaxID=1769908 RepID=A0A9P4WLR4_9PLEO|nr:hypothetical protein E8E12_004210 [Didymella heteroderae]